jgi:hypothetical protein
MFKGARARERLFAGLMWLVSIVLAGFLIGLGSLVIADLPKVSRSVEIGQFIDPARQAVVARQGQALAGSAAAASTRLEQAEDAAAKAQTAYRAAKETFDNWILTRAATSDRAQDPEVLSRTRELDGLKAAEGAADASRDAVKADSAVIDVAVAKNEAANRALFSAAQPVFERAKFVDDMKVFGFRLALTLPLLVISAWMLLRRRGSAYWPMMRGFILFSGFAFFVELVPYLPEYGGYVRYAVGVILTLVLGHYGIKGMRAYLKAREADETRAEPERVQSIEYDQALKKLAARACPGCDRTLPPAHDAPIDYCVHCGMHLFNHCPACDTRKFAFFRFCMTCGTPAVAEVVSAPAV